MRKIKVIDGKENITLHVKDSISLDLIKTYFPNAKSLTYIENEEHIGLHPIKGEIKLPDAITQFNVFNSCTARESNFMDLHKKRKIDEIMAVIKNSKTNEKEKKDSDKNSSKKKESKILEIGWKHRISKNSKFIQMKEPIGGIKQLELNMKHNYTHKEIKNLAIKCMKHKRNHFYFEDTIIEIGNYDNEIFDEFLDESGKDSNFWEFIPKIRQNNRHLKMYLLTTENETCNNLKENLDNEKVHNDSDILKDKLKKKDTSSRSLQIVLNQRTTKQSNINNSFINKSIHKLDTVLKSQITVLEVAKKKISNSAVGNSLKYRLDSEKNVQIILPHSENDTFNIDKSIIENLKLSIPIFDTEDVVLTSRCVGRGSYGAVNIGTWLGTEVAVKRVKMGTNNKYILREIQLMNRIRHPNIISIMAVGLNPIDCYIVMEHFVSSNLRHLFINGKKDNKYLLSEVQKTYILLQVCKAVSFMHELSPPIIHKDIKPENILVNEHALTKLCDLGLSKSDNLPSELLTTVGNNIKGTYHYMAPEILSLNEPPTIKADVWSLACVIFEMYSEEETWNSLLQTVEGDDEITKFKNLYKANVKPDLSLIPLPLKYILRTCFDQNIQKRPKATTLLDIIGSMNE